MAAGYALSGAQPVTMLQLGVSSSRGMPCAAMISLSSPRPLQANGMSTPGQLMSMQEP